MINSLKHIKINKVRVYNMAIQSDYEILDWFLTEYVTSAITLKEGLFFPYNTSFSGHSNQSTSKHYLSFSYYGNCTAKCCKTSIMFRRIYINCRIYLQYKLLSP
jgi:hypothetical protein